MPTAQATQTPPFSLLRGPQTFQVFRDNDKVKGYAQILHGTLEEHHDRLQQLNTQGMGIFFTVNQTDGKGRKAENITRVRAYICDIDNKPDPKQKLPILLDLLRSKLPPSAIIESKNGLHCYWYAPEGENLDQREYATVNQHLIDRFGGCTQSKDLARVLRVPGFQHVKDINQPFLIKRIYDEPHRLYTAEQIKATYPLPAKESKSYNFDARRSRTSDTEEELDENEMEFRWRRTVEGLAAWVPVDGEKHRVLLLAFGVARKLQIPQTRAEEDLYPIVAAWPTRDSPEQSILTHAAWAYSDAAGVAHINGLRSRGVEIDLRGGPRSKKWQKGKKT